MFGCSISPEKKYNFAKGAGVMYVVFFLWEMSKENIRMWHIEGKFRRYLKRKREDNTVYWTLEVQSGPVCARVSDLYLAII